MTDPIVEVSETTDSSSSSSTSTQFPFVVITPETSTDIPILFSTPIPGGPGTSATLSPEIEAFINETLNLITTLIPDLGTVTSVTRPPDIAGPPSVGGPQAGVSTSEGSGILVSTTPSPVSPETGASSPSGPVSISPGLSTTDVVTGSSSIGPGETDMSVTLDSDSGVTESGMNATDVSTEPGSTTMKVPIFVSIPDESSTADPFGFVTKPRPPVTKPPGFAFGPTIIPDTLETTASTIESTTSMTLVPFPASLTSTAAVVTDASQISITSHSTTPDPLQFTYKPRPPITKPPDFFSSTQPPTAFDHLGFVTKPNPIASKPPQLTSVKPSSTSYPPAMDNSGTTDLFSLGELMDILETEDQLNTIASSVEMPQSSTQKPVFFNETVTENIEGITQDIYDNIVAILVSQM